MKLEDLKPGMVVELTRDVTNPKPDRRSTRQFASDVVWKQGERLLVRNLDYLGLETGRGSVSHIHLGFEQLVDAAEPVDPDFHSVMLAINGTSRYMDYSYSILEVLVRAGKISLQDIKDAARKSDEDDE